MQVNCQLKVSGIEIKKKKKKQKNKNLSTLYQSWQLLFASRRLLYLNLSRKNLFIITSGLAEVDFTETTNTTETETWSEPSQYPDPKPTKAQKYCILTKDIGSVMLHN